MASWHILAFLRSCVTSLSSIGITTRGCEGKRATEMNGIYAFSFRFLVSEEFISTHTNTRNNISFMLSKAEQRCTSYAFRQPEPEQVNKSEEKNADKELVENYFTEAFGPGA